MAETREKNFILTEGEIRETLLIWPDETITGLEVRGPEKSANNQWHIIVTTEKKIDGD